MRESMKITLPVGSNASTRGWQSTFKQETADFGDMAARCLPGRLTIGDLQCELSKEVDEVGQSRVTKAFCNVSVDLGSSAMRR